MTLVNRKQISLYEEAESGLNSLVKQTAQVGVGLLGMLLLTGGNPPALTVGLSVVGGIAFVAWSEEKRLTKFYARHDYKHNHVIASEIEFELSQFSNHNELESLESSDFNNFLEPIIETDNLSVSIVTESLRQARQSFNAFNALTVISACLSTFSGVLLLSGKVSEGAVVACSGMGLSMAFLKLADDANDRIDSITKELEALRNCSKTAEKTQKPLVNQ
ncbi:MAG: hypothetical protein LH628_21785 [Microcoleus sp. CAN_BIN18]|nr:hypothetical protein [Microcoleus sp. CAN_BIN18]